MAFLYIEQFSIRRNYYENSGFKIKYKVVEKVEDLDDINNLNSGTWTIGNVVRNLSDTNVIIAKLTDSNGNSMNLCGSPAWYIRIFYYKGLVLW